MNKNFERILYVDNENTKNLQRGIRLIENYKNKKINEKKVLVKFINELIENAEIYGMNGNLWQAYLTNFIINYENSFSIACERNKLEKGSLYQAGEEDMKAFYLLYRFDFKKILEKNCLEKYSFVFRYNNEYNYSKVYNKEILNAVNKLIKNIELATCPKKLTDLFVSFYNKYGVGKYGLHKAFRVSQNQNLDLEPIYNIANINFADIVGYEAQKNELKINTEAFIKGYPANNCLLYGDAGTGKSTSIKALINEYFSDGLRIIEINKHQFNYLNAIIDEIKNRNYKYIIYMDDLSFEDSELEYKYLKAVIEGGIEKRPDNILIYATSNRRHLVRESFKDNQNMRDDINTNETIEEKLSLAARFGLKILYNSPDFKEFDRIVIELAKRESITMDEEELIKEARKWLMYNNGRTGRRARQFINNLLANGR